MQLLQAASYSYTIAWWYSHKDGYSINTVVKLELFHIQQMYTL